MLKVGLELNFAYPPGGDTLLCALGVTDQDDDDDDGLV